MASSDTPAVKRSGKVRNKRFVQPVLPALPQIPNTKKSDDIGTYQADHTVNGVTQETLEQGSERASPPALLDLPNGAHKDNIKEASGNGTHIETDMSPVVPSPALQNASAAVHPSSEPQMVPSTLPEQSALVSTAPLATEPNETPSDQPYPTTPDLGGFKFAPTLSQTRLARPREHHIMFHAPLESPSPSRATRRSLSDRSTSIPPPDLSDLLIASAVPHLGTPDSQERQKILMTKPELKQSGPAELPEHSQSPSLPDVPSVQAPTQPEFVLKPAGPRSTPSFIQFGGPSRSHNVFQPGGEQSDIAPPNRQLESQSHAIEHLDLTMVSPETQAETQNGYDRQRSDHLRGYPNEHQPNGYAQSSGGSVKSFSPEYLPGASDPEEHTVPSVSEQLTRLFITKEWSDWSIEVRSPVTNLDHVSYLAHGILMARSPTLRQEMQRKMFSRSMERVIVISPDWYIQPQGFEAVMRYLYMESLLTMQEVEQMSYIGASEDVMPVRDYQHFVILSYWMTGLILKLPLVVDRAVQLFQEALDWDVLELALQQGLVLEERTLNPSGNLLTTQPNTPGSSAAASASAASLRNISITPSYHFLPTANMNDTPRYRYAPINAIMSKEIKNAVFKFISQRVDTTNFEVDASSTTSMLSSYLPEIHEYSNGSHYSFNPALASIRFGDMPPAENETTPARAQWALSRSTAKVTSAILLNLKFADLREFCLVLKATREPASDNICEWIQKLVGEREKRRRKVLSSKTISNSQRFSEKQAWNVVGWEEDVHVTDEPGRHWEICQKWTGFTLPARR